MNHWLKAELRNKKSNNVIAYGVAKYDERGFYQFSLIPTLNRKKPINITSKSLNYVYIL